MSAECKEFMVRYMRCLWENSQEHVKCRPQAKEYLQCRMDKYVLNLRRHMHNEKYVIGF